MDNEKYNFTNNMEFDIITPTKFSLLIEQMVLDKKITYIDACL